MTTKISVVLPCFRGREWIIRSLSALLKQTLRFDRFEVLVVFNGPDDGAFALVETFHSLHPKFPLRCFKFGTASAALARNHGAEVATGDYVTWIDCDDTVSANYLELLLLAADETSVPVTQIVNVMGDELDANNTNNLAVLKNASPSVPPEDMPEPLTMTVCKAVPLPLAKKYPFDGSLKSGEDVALFTRLFATEQLLFNTIPAMSGAKYYRFFTSSSVSRKAMSLDFSVVQRLDVISSLDVTLQQAPTSKSDMVKRRINAQSWFIRSYLDENRNSATLVSEMVAERGLTYFPWMKFPEFRAI